MIMNPISHRNISIQIHLRLFILVLLDLKKMFDILTHSLAYTENILFSGISQPMQHGYRWKKIQLMEPHTGGILDHILLMSM